MRSVRVLAALLAAPLLAVLALPLAAPADAATATRRGTFVAGSGFYLAPGGGTDGLSRLGGTIAVSQASLGGVISVRGHLTGLAPRTAYVAVPYKDAYCLPVVGVTAFPSGAFTTNAAGSVTLPAGITVNPRAINPAGAVNVVDAHSISVRQVVLAAVALPPLPGYPVGLPKGTPTVPNAVAVQGCDRTLDWH